jgi:hypothetical protein
MEAGFVCRDSFLLYWNRLPVSAYQLYELGNKYLQPFAAPADTFAVLNKAAHPSVYYSIAPLVNGKPGLKSSVLNYNGSGVGCYFKSFFLQTQDSRKATFTASVGTLYHIKAVQFQKLVEGAYRAITTAANLSFTDFSFTDTALTNGLMYTGSKSHSTTGR